MNRRKFLLKPYSLSSELSLNTEKDLLSQTRLKDKLKSIDVDESQAKPVQLHQNEVCEWYKTSSKQFESVNAYELEVDIELTDPDGEKITIPAFWAGDSTWKFRISGNKTGTWTFKSINIDENDDFAFSGSFEVIPYTGDNPLYKHGHIAISSDKNHFVHRDGQPFFYLADTWWLGMSSLLRWPEEYQTLTRNRKERGFSVVRLTAGLNTDCTEFDPRSANEGGQPWEPEYRCVRPAYFDAADQRVMHLVDQGMVPAIIGSWGFYLHSMGVDKMKKH